MSSSAPPISLLPGERVLQHVLFSPRLILKHLKVTMILTDQRLYVSEPHTILGFIPHGYYTHTTPLECISDVQSGDRTNTRRAVGAVLVAIMGLYLMVGGGMALSSLSALFLLFGLILLAVAVLLMLVARRLALVVRTFGAGILASEAGSGDRQTVEMMQNMIFVEMMKARAAGHRTPVADAFARGAADSAPGLPPRLDGRVR